MIQIVRNLLLVITITAGFSLHGHTLSRYREVYFLDSESGNDENDGRSVGSSWKSLEKLDKVMLTVGDSVLFKRGSNYGGSLKITGSGSTGSYITLTDFGDPEKPAPSFTNPEFSPVQENFGNCIRLQGDYIVVENLYFHHTAAELPSNVGGFTTMWELGAVHMDSGATNCIVRNNEFFDCGAAIRSSGPYTLIENNYIHDCNRILKKWNWGPIGIWLGADHQEVRYNRIINYSVTDPRIIWGADSYGGGADGGAMEIDDARTDKSHISIHHNFTRDCQGFLEVTWHDVKKNPAYKDFLIHHNISDDYQQFVALWRGADCKIDHNTIIRRKVNANEWGVFNITQTGSENRIRNNIIVVEKEVVVFNTGKTGSAVPASVIESNLFFAASGSLHMGSEHPRDPPIISDPMFLNYRNGTQPGDFCITGTSPAINRGLDLGYHTDFTGACISQDNIPDIGAFEYRGVK